MRAEGVSFREAVAFYIRFPSKQKATGATGRGGTMAALTMHDVYGVCSYAILCVVRINRKLSNALSHMTALLPLRISLPLPHQSAALDGLLYNSSLFEARISLQRNTERYIKLNRGEQYE